jgi:hypothetical protein
VDKRLDARTAIRQRAGRGQAKSGSNLLARKTAEEIALEYAAGVHGNVVELVSADSVVDAPAGVAVVPCPEEVTHEPLDGIKKGRTAFGAELPHAFSACLLPIGNLAEYLTDEVLALWRAALTEQGSYLDTRTGRLPILSEVPLAQRPSR